MPTSFHLTLQSDWQKVMSASLFFWLEHKLFISAPLAADLLNLGFPLFLFPFMVTELLLMVFLVSVIYPYLVNWIVCQPISHPNFLIFHFSENRSGRKRLKTIFLFTATRNYYHLKLIIAPHKFIVNLCYFSGFQMGHTNLFSHGVLYQ